jgi:putative transposase
MSYNPNKHHRRSIRLKGYDYSQAGLYFITICCKNKACLFGSITLGGENLTPTMILNNAGKITEECWLDIPKHFPNVILHEHIIMPNHIHGIIELVVEKNVQPYDGKNNALYFGKSTKYSLAVRCSPSKTIGSVIRGFKIGVTKWFHENTYIDTVWQTNYYDIIIRNEQSYQNISRYIINNPVKWYYNNVAK